MVKTESHGKFCDCGCGGLAPIAKRTVKSRGYIKGMPKRFIVGHAARVFQNGKKQPNVEGWQDNSFLLSMRENNK